jgi:hypothetical protein
VPDEGMKHRALIATHHKTGTAWMTSTFRDICSHLKIRFVNLHVEQIDSFSEAAPPIVLIHTHGFSKMSWLLEGERDRIFHLIRDPRDVIISGMHFHLVAKEPWLHVPKRKFGGLSYQVKLNNLFDDKQRYLFEMQNTRTIHEMLRWDYDRPRSFECRYEELIEDLRSNLFFRIATHLGFSDS